MKLDMTDVLIAVELAPETAAKIRFMASEGIFGIDTGSAELHFKDGKLLKIVTHRTSYQQVALNENHIV